MGKRAGEEVWGCARSPPASLAVKIEGHRRLQKLERPGNRFPSGASRRNFIQWDLGQSSDLQNRKITSALSVVICLCSSRKHTATGRGMRKPRALTAQLTSLPHPCTGLALGAAVTHVRPCPSRVPLPASLGRGGPASMTFAQHHPARRGKGDKRTPTWGVGPTREGGRGQASSQLVPAAKGGQSERAHFRRRASVVPRKMRASTVGLRGLRGWESSSHSEVEQGRIEASSRRPGEEGCACNPAFRNVLAQCPGNHVQSSRTFAYLNVRLGPQAAGLHQPPAHQRWPLDASLHGSGPSPAQVHLGAQPGSQRPPASTGQVSPSSPWKEARPGAGHTCTR